MGKFFLAFALLLLGSVPFRTALAQTAGYSHLAVLKAKVFEDQKKSDQLKIAGNLVIKRWNPSPKTKFCIFFPYNDSKYGEVRSFSRYFEVLQPKKTAEVFYGGRTTFSIENKKNLEVREINPFLIEVMAKSPVQDLSIRFESTVPRLIDSDPNEWFFDGFHPQVLEKCPDDPGQALSFQPLIGPVFDVSIEIPSEWDFAGIGTPDPGRKNTYQSKHKTKMYSFALSKGYKKFSFKAGEVEVSAFYKTPDFEEQIITIKKAVVSFERWFGRFPFPQLIIIETSELQRTGIPGIVTFNQPKQQVFQSLQSEWLNWRHWVMVSLIGSQWYGAAIVPQTLDDQWLTSGIVEFAAAETMSSYPARFNLINTFDSGFHYFSFNYLQMQDLTAALLGQYEVKNTLTSTKYVSKFPFADQHPLLFVKQAVTLRHLKSLVGDESFSNFFRQMTEKALFHSLSPRDFLISLETSDVLLPEDKRRELAGYLKEWWAKEGWPDFALREFNKERLPSGKWNAEVVVERLGTQDIPTPITITDRENKNYLINFGTMPNPKDGRLHYSIVTDLEPEAAVIDPDHDLFDSNRFNNSSDYPSIKFFPGSANTFSDKDYTLVWVPYIFRRPGEPASVGLQSVLLSYIQSSVYLNAEAAPWERLFAFLAVHKTKLPQQDAWIAMTVKQKYDNSRLIEFAIDKSPLLLRNPKLGLGLRVRNRQTLGQPKETHYSIGLGSSLSSYKSSLPLTYDLNFEAEKVPKGFARDFEYFRKYSIQDFCFSVYKGVDLNIRGFWGHVIFDGNIPNTVLFNPEDVKEARLRIDIPDLPRSTSIATLNSDLLVPIFIPLPGDTLILSRQLRWKFFYDYGQSFVPDINYRAGGVGIIFPFGGDFVGMGSLALTRFSLLTVLYSNAGGEISRNPRLLFDMAGEF